MEERWEDRELMRRCQVLSNLGNCECSCRLLWAELN